MATVHDPLTNIGPSAIAHPNGHHAHPPPIPALHHLDDPLLSAPIRHTTSTQIGPNAIAPPVDHIAEDPHALEFPDLPAFPENVPTAPLLRLNLARLLASDEAEIKALGKACRELGFFYLDLRGAGGPAPGANALLREEHGIVAPLDETESLDGRVDGDAYLKDAAALFSLGEDFFALPEAEKQKYDFADQGSYFGYKGLGKGVVDAAGTKDRNEFYNVSKDDILATAGEKSDRLPAPAVLDADAARTRLAGFMRRSHAIVSLLLARLETSLQLPDRSLRSLHRLQAESGDQVRWVRAPPKDPASQTEAAAALGEHTDFGSVTLLFNRLGGLQVLPPAKDDVSQPQWCYVKPLRGHCVVNLGDAMVKFSAGVLRSNLHRVVAAPGEQGVQTRMSLVYFARPEDAVSLKKVEGSAEIDAAAAANGDGEEEEVNAKEWILRRALGRRTGGDWKKAGGTERRT